MSGRWTSGSLEGPAEAYVGLLAATILLLAANAGMFGVSRLVYSMGQYQQVPKIVSRLHPRYRTPYIGIAGCSVVAALLLLGPAAFLGNLYAAFAMLSFTVAHISVIALRRRYPDFERPYLGPGNIKMRGGLEAAACSRPSARSAPALHSLSSSSAIPSSPRSESYGWHSGWRRMPATASTRE